MNAQHIADIVRILATDTDWRKGIEEGLKERKQPLVEVPRICLLDHVLHEDEPEDRRRDQLLALHDFLQERAQVNEEERKAEEEAAKERSKVMRGLLDAALTMAGLRLRADIFSITNRHEMASLWPQLPYTMSIEDSRDTPHLVGALIRADSSSLCCLLPSAGRRELQLAPVLLFSVDVTSQGYTLHVRRRGMVKPVAISEESAMTILREWLADVVCQADIGTRVRNIKHNEK